MRIYAARTKRITTVGLTVSVAALVVALQPFFLGYMSFVTARLICWPIAFIVLCFLILHFLQNWRLLLALFKTRKPHRVTRLVATLLMMAVGMTDICSGWLSAVSGAERYILFPMWVWSWTFTLLVALHVYQRREVFRLHWRKVGQRI